MKNKAEKYARDTAARMRISGFTHYESERLRSYIENAYIAGWKAARTNGGIVEDVILKSEKTGQ